MLATVASGCSAHPAHAKRKGTECADVTYPIHEFQVMQGVQKWIYHRPAHGEGMEGHQWRRRMKRVLLIGFEPSTVDYSDPALPPGMTAEKIRSGIELTLADISERGWLGETCLINPDETAVPTVERRLATSRYDCVVVGAGLRLPANRLTLFEAVVNAIHRTAPQTAIAFNTRPEDTGAAAARWI